ncbi:glycerophosphodiester phosphodiesterase family protein [Aliiglaciecola sp. CAU 1673]|uniref:glycerophosphodiester phosphodiesterase n=1 Tax=Aliiglaciecola sp. CAU 1673 TaxID=3032595 RepID=UPI0023DA15D0|nr:glycerophosphodiester phosphodiesterase family protein [Aliiglaciecola sp. CAU 1673]MDF2178708.1 glycerophosphodiester phosphodiesterase family protein [Aliiglaciecola sp. CAU 1673]
MFVFAHRGASAIAPENTLLAIRKALEMEVDGIEIDIHSIEGELLVFHDRWLHRCTNGKGRLTDHSLAELRALDAGKGERIPLLWELLSEIRGTCTLNIEIKELDEPGVLISMVDKAIKELGFRREQLPISSFNHHLLRRIKLLKPEHPIGALTASIPLDYAAFAQRLGAVSLNAALSCICPELIQDAKSKGLKTYVYTVDQEQDMEMLASWGVDGIFSNYPDRAMAFCRDLPKA